MIPIDLARTAYALGVQKIRAEGLCFLCLPWDCLNPLVREDYIGMVTICLTLSVASPEELHALWVHEKLHAGWTYGRHLNPTHKTHPWIIGWDDADPDTKSQFANAFTLCKELGSWLS